MAVALERHLANRDPLAAALRLPASVDSEASAVERVDELVELLGLAPYADQLTGELSTGTRRIVDLACLLAQDPAVLLLDEPSAGVAQSETEALGPLLRRVQAETGCSLLVIEHDMPLLSSLCDGMVALELGAVIAGGTPAEVLADPRVISRTSAPTRTSSTGRAAGAARRPTARRSNRVVIAAGGAGPTRAAPCGPEPGGGQASSGAVGPERRPVSRSSASGVAAGGAPGLGPGLGLRFGLGGLELVVEPGERRHLGLAAASLEGDRHQHEADGDDEQDAPVVADPVDDGVERRLERLAEHAHQPEPEHRSRRR